MNSLEVSELGFKYEKAERWAFENVSFNAKQGSITAITGKNGAGKTTLLRCLCGIAPGSYKGKIKGRVKIFGQNLTDMKTADIIQNVGMVFQNPQTQLFSSTVEDELVFGPENLCVTREEIKQRLFTTMELVGLTHLRYENPLALSGGEQQLVAIASILMMNPKILLFDETMSWVDESKQIRIRDIIRKLRDRGSTILMVDHDEKNIKIADKIVQLTPKLREPV